MPVSPASLGFTRWLIAAAAAVWLLQTASVVLLPLAITVVLLALVHPIPRSAEAWLGRPGRIASDLLTAASPVLLVGVFGGATVLASSGMPVGSEQLSGMVDDVRSSLLAAGLPETSGRTLLEQLVPMASKAFEQVWSGILGAFVVSLLMLLVSGEAPALPHKLSQRIGPRQSRRVLDAWARYGRVLRRYLLVRVATGMLSGVLTTGWLAVLGVPDPWLWGGLTFVLNFVPNIGSMVAALPPTVVVFNSDGLGTAVLCASGLFLLEQLVGNYLDPRLQGESLRLSSTVILVAVLMLSWLWGPLGALLAVPILLGAIEAVELLPGGHGAVQWLRPAEQPPSHEPQRSQSA